MSENTFAQRNEELAIISREMFGDGMRLMIAAPASLTLLKDNARFFKRETFRQLRDNIAADKRLSSVPLCYRHEDGRLEVLSGNHRVQASIEAAIPHILVLVITEELDKSRRIAIQLSHNALVGEDDQSILANLWAQIESVQDKLYSGLDSESLKELGDVELVNFSTPQVPAHMVTFMFTDGEKEQLSEILDMLADAAKKSSAVHVCPAAQYEAFIAIINDVKHAEKIRDSSLAMTRLMEIAADYLEKQAAEAAMLAEKESAQ
ncbi:ParB N-terminal domain-containing protein [uncultured Desulfovibrio sp.]|uniref:ParB N-terminal domain-containing protein n=1 Tax=uncultured Desulfovibrio sp. TaxID=167968 RepID=UPI002638D3F6|nr:ParB N-terminal domain-containing protein [uncultured Desulfovibrio sp.]